ncbi:hypothetical protein WJ87_06075 [Burkholderia ubonensis]|nr:hypothetical protein WJ87_06075 [Burkholderia ubonensis]
MSNSHLAMWMLLPFVLLLFTSVGGFILRITTNVARPLRDYAYQPKVSVLLPVYNEGAHVLDTINSILEADWPKDRLEIVAIDDCSSDDSYEYMQQAQALHGDRLFVSKNDVNSGKHITLTNALAKASGEVVICIDSDCIFDKQVIRELVSCFADPKVGAVGGHIGVSNVNESVYTRAQAILYFLTFQVGKMVQNAQDSVFCISGCLFAVRREVFEEVEEAVRERNWFGVKVRDGEDRFMTEQILLRGWKTIINPSAVCWTAVPATMGQLFSQQLRWRRSTLRALFDALIDTPTYLRVLGARRYLTRIVPDMTTLLLALAGLTTIPIYGIGTFLDAMGATFVTSYVFHVLKALLYNLGIQFYAKGSEPIKHPFLVGLAGAWFFMDRIVLTVLALFTFDVGTWGTRETVNSKQPEVNSQQNAA